MDQIVEQLRAVRTCLRCRELYRDIDAMGRNQCRCHPGDFASIYAMPGVELGTWSCCGAPSSPHHRQWRGRDAALGCSALDHSDSPGVPVDETLAMEQAQVIFGDTLAGRRVTYDRRRRQLTICRAAPGVR